MNKIRNVITAMVVVMLITFSNSLFAQDDEQIIPPKFGVGSSLFNLTDLVWGFQSEPYESVLLTFNLGKRFRLEPTVGFAIGSGYQTYSGGIGAFYRKPFSKFNMLYGLRVGYNTEQIKLLAPTLSGEYYFHKRISIAGEMQLRWLHYDGEGVVLTSSSAVFRFYFK